MLEDKLAAANRETRRLRRNLLLALAGVALVTLLFLAGVIRVDLAQLGIVPDSTPGAAPVAVETATERPAPPTPALPTAPTAAAPAKPAPQADPASPEALAARTRFMALLAAFERDIEPRVMDKDFAAWNAALQAEIAAAKADSVASFAAGAYQAAAEGLGATAQRAADALAARDLAFDQALAAAQTAATGDDYDLAAAEIAEALRLRPDSVEAQALQARIARLPAILDLIARAAVARIENDPETEIELLEAALAANPARRVLAERLETVQGELRAARFAAQIETGMAAIARRDVRAARAALAAANAEEAGRPEAQLLRQRIDATARDIEAARLFANAGKAAAGDDWATAQTLYEKAATLLADDSRALAGAAQARRINELDARIGAQLARPERLAAPNVAAQARALLAESADAAGDSTRLATARTALADALAAWTTPVPVTIVSDGLTHVSVRGVGQVGTTTGRSIDLPPGQYTFEGARPGYRSTLVPVEIAPGATGIRVEVVCHEPV